jgi:hypothetical protein
MGFSAIQNIPRPNGVVQMKVVQSSSKMSSTAIIPKDNTRPQISEGVEFFNLSITPTDVNSTILIKCSFPNVSGDGSAYPVVAIFRNDQTDALIAQAKGIGQSRGLVCVKTVAGTTSPLTISMRFGPNIAGTSYMNADTTNTQYFGGAWIITIYAIELAA